MLATLGSYSHKAARSYAKAEVAPPTKASANLSSLTARLQAGRLLPEAKAGVHTCACVQATALMLGSAVTA